MTTLALIILFLVIFLVGFFLGGWIMRIIERGE